jgi:ribosomal protein S18 acetylase RimI-like enzyme
VRRDLERLHADGVTTVVTAALAADEQEGFLDAGMVVRERLHLLERDIDSWPLGPRRLPSPHARLRRTRRRDRSGILALDAEAFDGFWHFDEAALREALTATPTARFRVSGSSPVGYAITGRSGHRGYLQRLAVHPAAQRSGIGTALVDDGLRWLRRRGVATVLVNTQIGNDAALALYEGLGFTLLAGGLTVLEHRSDPSTC